MEKSFSFLLWKLWLTLHNKKMPKDTHVKKSFSFLLWKLWNKDDYKSEESMSNHRSRRPRLWMKDFVTWVSLGIFLLWSVNHSFHKRLENDFFTWVSLDMVAVCVPLWHLKHDDSLTKYRVNHIFTRGTKITSPLLHMNLFKVFSCCEVLTLRWLDIDSSDF